MLADVFGDRTFVGVASVIAALASLVSAVGTIMNNRRIKKVGEDVEVVKKNGHGEGGTA